MNIFKTHIVCFLFIISFCGIANAQIEKYENENEIILAADNFFTNGDYQSATTLYSHLLSLDRTSYTYKYRFSVCLLNVRRKDASLALKNLEQINGVDFYDDEYYYYLGVAYHLNYRFKEAINAYTDYQLYAKMPKEEYFVDRKIDMCENAMSIIDNINDLYVINNSHVPINGFYRSYNLSDFGGVFLKKPKSIVTRLDKKNDKNPIVFYSEKEQTIFYSSYGKNGKSGKDIYMAKMVDGKLSASIPLDGINTSFDDDYPYFVANGGILYFSSKGYNSIGGYDIFYSIYDSIHLKWSKPIALNFAINTPYNDFLFVSDINQKYACFASDRNADMDMVSVYRVRIDTKPEENDVDVNSIQLSLDNTSQNYNATIEYLNEYGELWVNTKEEMYSEIEEEYYQKSNIQLDQNITIQQIVDTAFYEYNIIKKEYEEFLKLEKAAFALSNDKIDKVKQLEKYILSLDTYSEEYDYYNKKLEEAIRIRNLSISTTQSIEKLIDNKRIELDLFLSYAGEVQTNVTNSDLIESKNSLVLLLEKSQKRNKIIDLEQWYGDDVITDYQTKYDDIDLGILNVYIDDIFKQIRGINKFPASEMKFHANVINGLSDEYNDLTNVFDNQNANNVSSNNASNNNSNAVNLANNATKTVQTYSDLVNMQDYNNQINNLNELLENDIKKTENLSNFLYVEAGKDINNYNEEVEDGSIDQVLSPEMINDAISARINYNIAETQDEYKNVYLELYDDLLEIKKKNIIEELDQNDIDKLNDIAIRAEILKLEQQQYLENEAFFTDEISNTKNKSLEVNNLIEEEYRNYDLTDAKIETLVEERQNLSRKGVKEVDKEIEALQFKLDSIRDGINYLEEYSTDLDIYTKILEQQSRITLDIVRNIKANENNIADNISVDGDIGRLDNEIKKAYKRYHKDLDIDKFYDNSFFNADILLLDNIADIVDEKYQTQSNIYLQNNNSNTEVEDSLNLAVNTLVNPIDTIDASNINNNNTEVEDSLNLAVNTLVNPIDTIDASNINNNNTEVEDSLNLAVNTFVSPIDTIVASNVNNNNTEVEDSLNLAVNTIVNPPDTNNSNVTVSSADIIKNYTVEDINKRYQPILENISLRNQEAEQISLNISRDLAENAISISLAEISIIKLILQNEKNPQKQDDLNRRIIKLDSIIEEKERNLELILINPNYVSNNSLNINYTKSNNLVDFEQIFAIADSIKNHSKQEIVKSTALVNETSEVEDELVFEAYLDNAKIANNTNDYKFVIANDLLIDAYQNKYQSLYIVYSSWQADLQYLSPDMEYALFNAQEIMDLANSKVDRLAYCQDLNDSLKLYEEIIELYKQSVEELEITINKIEVDNPELHNKEDLYSLLESFYDNQLELSATLYPETLGVSTNTNTNTNINTNTNTNNTNVNTNTNFTNINNIDSLEEVSRASNSLIFKVQIAASKRKVGAEYFAGVDNLEVEKLNTSVYYRYMTGATSDLNIAFANRDKMRALTYKDAFVVAYLDGKRISIAEARKHINSNTIIPVANNTAANTEAIEKSEVTKVENVSGLCYSIQVGVYGTKRNSESLFGIQDLYYDIMQNGYYRYFSGTFTDYGQAINSRNTIRQKGVADAYIVAFYNGKKISVVKANELSRTMQMGIKVNGQDVENINTQPANTTVEVYLSVQIGAFSKEVPIEMVNKFLSISSKGIYTHRLDNGITIYYAGKLVDKNQVETLKQTVIRSGINDAFIIGFIDGKKVSRLEAEKNL